MGWYPSSSVPGIDWYMTALLSPFVLHTLHDIEFYFGTYLGHTPQAADDSLEKESLPAPVLFI